MILGPGSMLALYGSMLPLYGSMLASLRRGCLHEDAER